jgi:hypothetical protein
MDDDVTVAESGRHDGRVTNVTKESALGHPAISMGGGMQRV